MSVVRGFIVLGCLCVASAASAGPARLSDEALTEAVSGSLIALDTPVDIKLPIRFTHDGFMSGEAGELASVLGSPSDRGRWWVKGDRLCYKWFRWFDAEEHCITVERDGQRIRWVQDDGKDGTATIVEQGQLAAVPAKPESRSFGVVGIATAEAATVTPQRPVATSIADAAPQPATVAPTPSAAPPPAALKPELTEPAARKSSLAKKPLTPSKPSAATAVTTKKPPNRTTVAAVEPVARRVPAVSAAKPKMAPAAKSPPQAANVELFRVEGVEDDDILNVRKGPSEEHAAVGAIPPTGRGVKITGSCRNDWCPVRHGGTTGWVNRYYLVEDEPEDRIGQR